MQRLNRRICFRLHRDDACKYSALIGKVFGIWNWTDLLRKALDELWRKNNCPMPAGKYPLLDRASDKPNATQPTLYGPAGRGDLRRTGVDAGMPDDYKVCLAKNGDGAGYEPPASATSTSSPATAARASTRSMACTSSPTSSIRRKKKMFAAGVEAAKKMGKRPPASSSKKKGR